MTTLMSGSVSMSRCGSPYTAFFEYLTSGSLLVMWMFQGSQILLAPDVTMYVRTTARQLSPSLTEGWSSVSWIPGDRSPSWYINGRVSRHISPSLCHYNHPHSFKSTPPIYFILHSLYRRYLTLCVSNSYQSSTWSSPLLSLWPLPLAPIARLVQPLPLAPLVFLPLGARQVPDRRSLQLRRLWEPLVNLSEHWYTRQA